MTKSTNHSTPAPRSTCIENLQMVLWPTWQLRLKIRPETEVPFEDGTCDHQGSESVRPGESAPSKTDVPINDHDSDDEHRRKSDLAVGREINAELIKSRQITTSPTRIQLQ